MSSSSSPAPPSPSRCAWPPRGGALGSPLRREPLGGHAGDVKSGAPAVALTAARELGRELRVEGTARQLCADQGGACAGCGAAQGFAARPGPPAPTAL